MFSLCPLVSEQVNDSQLVLPPAPIFQNMNMKPFAHDSICSLTPPCTLIVQHAVVKKAFWCCHSENRQGER